MSDCNFRARIVVATSAHEFTPAGGWHPIKHGWAKFYSCCDTGIVRRAVIKPSPDGGWEFAVSKITERYVLSVARQPGWAHATQPTQCMHAADMTACGQVREARAL
jgi:hypothetical protein